jgi:chromosomal replication initiation ATPase DnaA
MAGLEKRGVKFVPDTGIDLRRRQPEPVRIVYAPDPRLDEYRRIADEAIERGNIALARLRELEDELGERRFTPITLSRIERRISKALKVPVHEIHSNRRTRHVVLARQAVTYWAYRLTSLSLPEIGRRLGGKDHTSILHGKTVYPKKRAAMGRYLREAR